MMRLNKIDRPAHCPVVEPVVVGYADAVHILKKILSLLLYKFI